ncbi:MAG: AraC family transcriptional regulator, partial [Oscillospiraceae bacterium]
AKKYIDANYPENITIDFLAELTHLNKFYLMHAFTREYNISPINYLIERRIRESKYLLANTDHSLAQISNILGFSSPSYFSQSFKRLEKTSPREYRNSHRFKQ